MIAGFIHDPKSWHELLAWVRAQHFDDHDQSPDSIPYRVEAILKNYAKMPIWDGTQVQFSKGFIAGHYTAKPIPTLSREEQLARGQIEMSL